MNFNATGTRTENFIGMNSAARSINRASSAGNTVEVNGEKVAGRYSDPAGICKNGTLKVTVRTQTGNRIKTAYFKPGTEVQVKIS